MKRHIFNTFILGFAIASCTDPFMGQTATDHVAPGPIKNAKVINLEGSALITYDLPEDEDLLYIKATYQRNKDVIAQNKASVYTDTLTIVGLGDTLARGSGRPKWKYVGSRSGDHTSEDTSYQNRIQISFSRTGFIRYSIELGK